MIIQRNNSKERLRTIELKSSETINCCDEQKQKRDKSSGIKLLRTSKKLLIIAKVGEECTNHDKKSRKKRQITKNEDLSKFQEAAIDPEYILSKLNTKVWVNKHPESEFKYKKLKNGTLIEM